ncbi:hypothetical protein CEP53_002081 [Fusarium sp. AF-6]|nr:hypothetical protein CEP53_002081 [Fusarium sp. AF-6]
MAVSQSYDIIAAHRYRNQYPLPRPLSEPKEKQILENIDLSLFGHINTSTPADQQHLGVRNYQLGNSRRRSIPGSSRSPYDIPEPQAIRSTLGAHINFEHDACDFSTQCHEQQSISRAMVTPSVATSTHGDSYTDHAVRSPTQRPKRGSDTIWDRMVLHLLEFLIPVSGHTEANGGQPVVRHNRRKRHG